MKITTHRPLEAAPSKRAAQALTTRAVLVWLAALALLLCRSAAAPAAEEGSLYWALHRDGKPAGFLLGTIHSEDPRVLEFSESFLRQLGGNEVFAMEMVPNLPTLTRLMDYMQYQDGTTLVSQVGAERYARIRSALANYAVPGDWIERMKVWAAMMTLSVPPPESGLFMDFALSLRAAGAGLEVVGLESLEEQLSFLEEMPLAQQIALLDEALEEYRRVHEVHDALVESYLNGDAHALRRLAEQQMARLDPEAKAYFLNEGIEARNRRMLKAALEYLAESKVFIAVGALHLPGENGLVALLRRAGYRLQPLSLPLAENPAPQSP